MHETSKHLLKRSVLLLLVARVVAAPIALRPAPADDPARSGMVVRVCAWPAQQVRSGSDKLTVGDRPTAPDADLPHRASPRPELKSSPNTHPSLPAGAYTRLSFAPLRC